MYVPCLISEHDDIAYEAGGFSTEAEAQRVIDIWIGEGRTGPTAINLISIYSSVEEWQADR